MTAPPDFHLILSYTCVVSDLLEREADQETQKMALQALVLMDNIAKQVLTHLGPIPADANTNRYSP